MNDNIKYDHCYLKDGTKFTINEYNILINKKENSNIFDGDGNKLVYCNGPIVKPYFRKKNLENLENPMTDWHKSWEDIFNDLKEKNYKHENMITKNRRADVDLNESQIIEFQNSPITIEEINNRQTDWLLVNKKIIWVINGNDTIEVTNLEHSGRVFLEFMPNEWKYKSFLNYEQIYINIKNDIYIINPNEVRSNMIDVQKPILKNDFIEMLRNKQIPLHEGNSVYQTTIYTKQQGAGNGKTYGIIQLLQDKNFSHYDTFIYLTKQHSAVHVIYEEMQDQIKRNLLPDIKFTNDDFKNKKHIIDYKYNNIDKKIIIGTFDSFNYALVTLKKEEEGHDKFQSIVNSIINNELKASNIIYANGIISLNKKMLIIGDEMQDLNQNYIKAIIKISRDRYVDFYGVGDKLQSISMEHNSFTFLVNANLTNKTIKHIIYPFTNICRRFNDNALKKFVNYLIPFNKYKIPDVEIVNNNKEDQENIIIIQGEEISNDKSIEYEINKIMDYYKLEVNNGYEAKDFLIVTPFANNNFFVDNINDSIREFWLKRTNDDTKIYSYFHKSSDCQSIDLKTSDDCTRIVSIHSSKGDGRPIVFVIGITELNLKKFSTFDKDNIIYDSLLHVAITRMKKKLYFRIEQNMDDIHEKIDNYLKETNNKKQLKPIIKISININLPKLYQPDKIKNEIFCNLKTIIIEKSPYNTFMQDCRQKEIIDLKHHITRFAIFYTSLIIQIINNMIIDNIIRDNNAFYQIYVIFLKCKDFKVKSFYNTIDYNKSKFFIDRDTYARSKFIPILEYSKDYKKYHKYSNHLSNGLQNVQKKIKELMTNKVKLKLEPIESIYLYYMMEIIKFKNYASLSISDLYDIIDIYYKEKKHKKEEYLEEHYNNNNKVAKLYKIIYEKYKDLKWNIQHKVILNSNKDYFNIVNKYNLISYNDNTVLIFYIKPQFNDLNYYEILLDSIFDTYLLKNIKKDTDNYKKYNNKKIITVVMSYDKEEPFIIDWCQNNEDLINDNKNIIKQYIKDGLYFYFNSFHKKIYSYYIYKYRELKNINYEPVHIIDEIKDDLDDDKCPSYIRDIFVNIYEKVEDEVDKEEQLKILDKYTNEEVLINILHNKLKKTIDSFLREIPDLNI